jgi:hypothetical protein
LTLSSRVQQTEWNPNPAGVLDARRFQKEISMLKMILTAATIVLFSSAVMAQSTDTKAPATTGPAAQSDNMAKGDMSKSKMSKKKMSKSKSAKMKKPDEKM